MSALAVASSDRRIAEHDRLRLDDAYCTRLLGRSRDAAQRGHSCHGSRRARSRKRLASSSPGNSCLAGSHFSDRFNCVGDDAQVAHGHGVDGQFDVAERLLAGLDAFEEVAVDAALALVGRHGLRRPLLARRAYDLQVAHAGVVVVEQQPVGKR